MNSEWDEVTIDSLSWLSNRKNCHCNGAFWVTDKSREFRKEWHPDNQGRESKRRFYSRE